MGNAKKQKGLRHALLESASTTQPLSVETISVNPSGCGIASLTKVRGRLSKVTPFHEERASVWNQDVDREPNRTCALLKVVLCVSTPHSWIRAATARYSITTNTGIGLCKAMAGNNGVSKYLCDSSSSCALGVGIGEHKNEEMNWERRWHTRD